MALGILCAFLIGCDRAPETVKYTIHQLKDESEKKENEYARLSRNSLLILEVKVLDRLNSVNSSVLFDEDGNLAEIYSYRGVEVLKVLKGDPELVGQHIFIYEPVAISAYNGYEYYYGQLETALVEELTYLVFLDRNHETTFFPLANEGFAKWALNDIKMAEDWVILTLLNDYAGMSPRRNTIVKEEAFELNNYDAIFINYAESVCEVNYFYNAKEGKTYIIANHNRYYSVSGKVSFNIVEEE